jgi:hypothetical protein
MTIATPIDVNLLRVSSPGRRSCSVAVACLLIAAFAGPAAAAPHGAVAFLSRPRLGTVSSLYVAAVSTGAAHRVSRPRESVEAFAWSPSGGSLAYAARVGRASAEVIVELGDGTHPRVISRCAVPCPLAWSPDGTSLAIPGTGGRVRVVRVVDGHARTVARVRGRVILDLAWAPDGTMLAARTRRLRSSGGGSLQLVTLGVGRSVLVAGGVTSGPRWSPDGTTLLYIAGGTAYSLGVGTGGGVPLPLAPASSASISPDGGRIAYANGSGLWLMNNDGSAQTLLRAGRISTPAWSPDGAQLAYARAGTLSVGDLVGSVLGNIGYSPLGQALWRPVRPLSHASLPSYAEPVLQHPSPLGAASVYALSASGDFNDDGLQDVIVARQARSATDPNGTSGTPMPLGVIEDDGHGHLVDASARVFGGAAPGIIQPKTMILADFNEDGRPDVFIGSDGFTYPAGVGRNRLFLSAGDGQLADATSNLPADQGFAFSVASADVNGDGHADLFVDYPFSNGAPPPEIWLGNGRGHFSNEMAAFPPTISQPGHSYATGAFADVNGDGAPDLVLGAFDQTTSSAVLLNDGSGHFTTALPLPPRPLQPDAQATAVQPVDLDGDGRTDLLVAYTIQNPNGTAQARWLQVLMGNGDGTFRDETASRFPQMPNQARNFIGSMQLLDINGDGTLDVAAHLIGPAPQQAAFYLVRDGTLSEVAFPAFAGGGLSEWQPIDLYGSGQRDLFQAYADPQQAFSTEAHPVYMQTDNPLPPGPPASLRAWNIASRAVRLSWDYSWGAVAYQVWRATPGTPARWVATTHRTHLDDTTAPTGTSITYTIRAANSAGTSLASPSVLVARATP